jgi:N-acyl-D-aspartate/D-glutamate deacylase
MTTYLLTHWARDRTRGPKLTREWAVRRLTRDPAHLYGLHDRGVIAPGKRADLNVIDYERLRLVFPEQVHDLPAGPAVSCSGPRATWRRSSRVRRWSPTAS